MEKLDGFIDEFMNTNEPSKNAGIVTDEESISVENVNNVEAVPFFVDEFPEEIDEKRIYTGDGFKKAVEKQISESGKIASLDHDVDGNKIMIQDLKSSVVSLKVSTSRIEREVKELGDSVGRFNAEKRALDNSLIDLEFRFNELVADQEADEKTVPQQQMAAANNNNNNGSTNNEDYERLQLKIRNVIENFETKVQQMDEKITVIDAQNSKVKNLSRDIEKHEQMVQNIRKMLAIQERELAKITELKEFPPAVDNTTQCQSKCPSPEDTALQHKVDEFIAKTELNERSIATAWVGLIAALLLIPIAYFMGKFF